MNKRQAHVDWLQERRMKFVKQHQDAANEKQKLEENRQVR